MKNLLIVTILLSTFLVSCSDDDPVVQTAFVCEFVDYKYYQDNQDYIGALSEEYILIGVEKSYSNPEVESFISELDVIDQEYEFTINENGAYDFKEITLKFKSLKTCEQITEVISDLEQHSIISYAHYTMQTDDCNNLIWESIGSLCINSYSSSFSVKVFDAEDLTDLNEMVDKTKTEIVKQNQFMPQWFELRATKSSDGDALKMANTFYESGLFEHSEPNITKYAVEQ